VLQAFSTIFSLKFESMHNKFSNKTEINSSKKYNGVYGIQKTKSGIQATRCFRCGNLQKENEYLTK
jgi:hypothetical protein